MATTDFRKLAIDICLADGKIDDSEIKIIKKTLYEDGKIDAKEVEFLIELRSQAQKKFKNEPLSTAFETFFFKALSDAVLDNGIISNRETTLLRKAIFADGKVEASEKKFMVKLKKAATKTSPLFDKLYQEVVGM